MPLDAYRWTPKGETNGLSTLYVQKAYEFDVGDSVLVFCGRRLKISIIHNYNLTENFGSVAISLRLATIKKEQGDTKFALIGGGGNPIVHNNNLAIKLGVVRISFRWGGGLKPTISGGGNFRSRSQPLSKIDEKIIRY